MSEITLHITGQQRMDHEVIGGFNYAVLNDNSDNTYIKNHADSEKTDIQRTSIFVVGSSNAISGRFVVTGINTTIRNKQDYSAMKKSTMSANLFIGGIEGKSWGCSLGSNWSNRSHSSAVSEFSSLNNKLLTALPEIVLHIASVVNVNKTDDNRWNGASEASVKLTYDNYYIQSAVGSTGVSASVSSDESTVSGYYKSGSNTTYTANLSTNYGFRGWFTSSDGSGNPVSVSPTYTETCSSDRTLYAFAFKVEAYGSTGVSASLTRASDGRTFTFSAALSNDYALDGWYNGSERVSRNTAYSVTLDSSCSLTAKAYRVTYSGDSHVSVSASRNSDGISYTFTGNLLTGNTAASTIDRWTVNGTQYAETNNIINIPINSDTVVSVSSFYTTVSSDIGFESVYISRNSAKSLTLNSILKPGYDFDGWYSDEVKIYGSEVQQITPVSDKSYIAKSIHHIYSIDAISDEHSTAEYSTSDFYYGTTVTFTASVTDNRYVFEGWYTDSSYTELYSSSLVTTYTITGDKILYAKTHIRKRIFYKENNQWKVVPNVYVKVNNQWHLLSYNEYENAFHQDVKYIKK